ncbi:hypothetical protein GGX14DRAFT_569163 [Mycena pura]|uniref:Uncharacterized protein n=1 Tax=Mycena pura TaxID=153505 RepID=A0AAD6VBE3_9AGAR|nr:hypothetical protein GGX14DRAFT_569163 [Mycena pura]
MMRPKSSNRIASSPLPTPRRSPSPLPPRSSRSLSPSPLPPPRCSLAAAAPASITFSHAASATVGDVANKASGKKRKAADQLIPKEMHSLAFAHEFSSFY